MALNRTTLDALHAHGFGPLTVEPDGPRWRATFAGRHAEIGLDDVAVQVEAARPTPWPTGALPADEIDTRIAVALHTLELTRHELCTIRPDAGHRSVVVTTWLDATTATVVDLATAVRNVLALGDLAAQSMGRVANAVDADVQARAANEEITASIERARRALLEPAATPVAASFAPTHIVPPGGLRTWPRPDPTAPQGAPLTAGTAVRLLERRGDWAHVQLADATEGWIDGRALV